MNDPTNATAGHQPYTQFKKLTDLERSYSLSGDIHVPRSLDQSYYVGLDSAKDTVTQDRDQVIYKYMNKQIKCEKPNESRLELDSALKKQAKILTVNQLWLWRLDKSMFEYRCGSDVHYVNSIRRYSHYGLA